MKLFYKFLASMLTIICFLNILFVPTISQAHCNDCISMITEEDLLDDSVNVIMYYSFSTSDPETTALSDEELIDKAIYSYTFIQSTDDTAAADVDLTFTIYMSNTAHTIDVSGTIDAYPLSSGDTFWEGLLTGSTEISGTEYKVLASFSKLDSSNAIQVSVTIQPRNEDEPFGALIFTFGDDIITSWIDQELSSCSSYDEICEDAPVTASSSDFTQISYDFAYFNSSYSISGFAQRARAYYDSTGNRVAITLLSYCSNVNDYFSSYGTASTTVKSFTTMLTRTGTAYSYISGTESFDFDESNYGSGECYILALFEDILSLLNVPSSTISAILSGLKGSVSRTVASNTASVSVSFSLLQAADFDDSSTGLPIVFQLGYSSSGRSYYVYQTSLTYRTVYVASGTTTPVYIYIDAYDASASIGLTVE